VTLSDIAQRTGYAQSRVSTAVAQIVDRVPVARGHRPVREDAVEIEVADDQLRAQCERTRDPNALALPALIAGVWLGLKLYGKLDDLMFRKVILTLLFVSGLSLIVPLH